MREYWLEIPGNPQYMISTYGDIISSRLDRNLVPCRSSNGYYKVKLNGMQLYVHQLVARTFIEGWRHGIRVNHIDGDRSNNRLDNLCLLEGHPRGDGEIVIPQTIYRWGQRVQIKETGDVFRTVRDCAAHIGGDYSAIYACLRGDRTHHLGYTFKWF